MSRILSERSRNVQQGMRSLVMDSRESELNTYETRLLSVDVLGVVIRESQPELRPLIPVRGVNSSQEADSEADSMGHEMENWLLKVL
jgi:hypothetical protein